MYKVPYKLLLVEIQKKVESKSTIIFYVHLKLDI